MKQKVTIDRKPLASEEINATKDFSSLVNKVGTASSVSPKSTSNITSWLVGGIAVIAVVTGIYFGTKESPDSTLSTQSSELENLSLTPYVNPLLAEADIKNESYYINADLGGKIKHHTGSEITIPKGAFMDEEGNIIQGEVEIQYREFHDQADIFLSGIPMEYDSAGDTQIFESAGMMEIRGFKDGKRLKIVPDKGFVICMHSKNPDPKFNLYYLDEENREWDYIGKDSIVNPELTQLDSNGLDFSNADFTNSDLITETREVEKEVKEIKEEIKTIKKTEPSKPKKANPKKKNFTIDVVESEYPELAVYTGTVFEVIDNSKLPKDTYTVTWSDVQLLEKDNSYSVQLSRGKRKEEIAVVPVLDGKNYEEAKLLFDSKFSEYSSVLTKKLKEEKVAEIKLAELKEKYRKEKEEYERKMLALKANLSLQTQSLQEMQRVFKITTFGTWNCDSRRLPPSGMLVRAFYKDKLTGKSIEFQRLDLIQKSTNACFPLDEVRRTKFSFNPKKKNLLWGITTDGMIAVAHSNEFDASGNANTHTFNMKVFDIKGKSTYEIKQLLKS